MKTVHFVQMLDPIIELFQFKTLRGDCNTAIVGVMIASIRTTRTQIAFGQRGGGLGLGSVHHAPSLGLPVGWSDANRTKRGENGRTIRYESNE